MPELPNLVGLLGERPATKMGQVRAAWSQIQAALRAGHTLKAIWQRLRADGVNIHYNRFCECVGRLQRAPISKKEPRSAPHQTETAGLVSQAQTSRHETDDLAANLRDRLDRSTGFSYPGTRKKEDLV